MRLFAVLPLLLVLLVGTAATAATKKPALKVLTASPLVVSGTNFKAGEVVRLSTLGRVGETPRRVVASRTGVFKTKLSARPKPGCGAYGIVAVGSQGSRATVQVGRPCVPPPLRD